MKFKRFFLFFLFILTSFLLGCGSSEKEDLMQIKFGNNVLKLQNNYILSNVSTGTNDLNILYSYKQKQANNGFYNSIIIGEYTRKYPKSEKEFFSIMLNKLNKELVGVKILDKGNFSENDEYIYFVKYKVDDNLFGGDKLNIYYALQVYLFDKKNKKVYIISAVGLEESFINDIFDSIKNLQVN